MWSPQINLPLSGGVTQDLAPDINWFFQSIPPQAGVGSIEREVFRVASYGRQLGLILDILLPLARNASLEDERAKQSLAELENVYEEICEVKRESKAEMEQAAVRLLKKIEEADGEMLHRVIAEFDH